MKKSPLAPLCESGEMKRPGLDEALIALAFFRCRNDRRKKYKTGRRCDVMISARRDMVKMARMYIKKARDKGWQGSVLAAVMGS